MLKELINKYGKQRVNSLTKYPSILTLHSLGKHNRLTEDFTTDICGEQMEATEKINGTNIRLLFYGAERLVGTRDNIFYFNSGDFLTMPKEFFGMIDFVKPFYQKPKWMFPMETDCLTVVFGELYGGGIGDAHKNYGEKLGFRVFDIAQIKDLSILEQEVEAISRWREHSLNSSQSQQLSYGQEFLQRQEIKQCFPQFELVPSVPFEVGDMSRQTILKNLRKFIPESHVALSDTAIKAPEGVVLRNADRSKIVKLRFEDYERALR